MNSGNRLMGWALLLFGGLALLIASGCEEGPKPAAQAPPRPLIVGPALLASGDQIELKFFYDNELNVTQTIRPDGKITLELVGEVQAAGVTPTALAADLKQRYTEYLKHPDIAVFLRASYERRVYVTGSVLTPRVLDMPDNMSALEAIMACGGFNLLTANTSQVIVMRDNGHHGRDAYALDMSGVIKGRPGPAFDLEPKDIVYVPRTFIVDLDQFVLQYIGGLVPDGLIYTKTFSGGATIGVQTQYNAGVSP
jgi:protein involved in polysaccharide export with SLBB domain